MGATAGFWMAPASPAGWFWRLVEMNFLRYSMAKVRADETAAPARKTRARPNPLQIAHAE
jgi:hypothetical protein